MDEMDSESLARMSLHPTRWSFDEMHEGTTACTDVEAFSLQRYWCSQTFMQVLIMPHMSIATDDASADLN